MARSWSQRLLTLLQLTRMALVFTAIADGWCGLVLWSASQNPGASLEQLCAPWRMALLAAVSVGLYGFGMTLNDIIDRRRDQQISPTRPLPSGRVSIITAHAICFGLLLVAVVAGAFYRIWGGPDFSLWLVAITLALIYFYDAAGKYLVGPGLVALGLVRFAQAMIPALGATPPFHPLLWHPLWLLNHVTILSTVCYAWEQKRPALNIKHWLGVFGTLLAIDAGAIALVIGTSDQPPLEAIRLDLRLIIPAGASLVFIAFASHVKRTSPTSRGAGQATMLYGLLWLIVYDACFAGAYVHWFIGGGLLLLLPIAYSSVRIMRGWSKLVAASQRPDFKRAGVGPT